MVKNRGQVSRYQLPAGPGRPKGSRNKATLVKQLIESYEEDLVVKHFEKIMKKAVEMASEGDPAMIKLIFDRVIPKKVAVSADAGLQSGKGGITINITGSTPDNTKQVTIEGNIEDAEEIS